MGIVTCRLFSLVIQLGQLTVLVDAAEDNPGGADVTRAKDLAAPVLLIDADHPIAAPFVADLDGDGSPELLVGEFRKDEFSEAGIHVYHRIGKPADLQFDVGASLQADGRDATVPAFCYTGAAPQIVDFNNDGIPDLVSPIPGDQFVVSLRLFPGLGQGRFGQPTDLTCWNAAKMSPRQSCYNARTFVYDWDGDGSLDILVSVSGGIWLLRNLGDRGMHRYAAPEPVTVDGANLRVALGSLCMADWDGDGRDDLITGDSRGGVHWYRNSAKVGEPLLASGLTLVPPGNDHIIQYPMGDPFPRPAEISRSARVCVADVTGEGKVDLIVGDWVSATAVGPDPTNEQRVALQEVQRQLRTAREALEKLMAKNPPAGESRDRYDEELELHRADCRSLADKVQQLQQTRYERHGSVWLFQRLAE